MFVLGELKKSIKELEDISKKLKTITDLTEFDQYEMKIQKVVFELQMKANQVAGEIVPQMRDKRTELQNANGQAALERVRMAKERVAKSLKAKEEKPVEKPAEKHEPVPYQLGNTVEDINVLKTEDKDGNSDRQPESNAGDSKPKSAKKTK